MSTLEERQKAGHQVERKMVEFFLQWPPAYELKVGDILQAASFARSLAFDAFSEGEDR